MHVSELSNCWASRRACAGVNKLKSWERGWAMWSVPKKKHLCHKRMGHPAIFLNFDSEQQERVRLTFSGRAGSQRLTMNITFLRSLHLLAGIIFFSNLSLAVCLGSSHQTSLVGYALSPDATRIAAIAEDGALFWWDVASGKRTQLAECIHPEVFDHPILFSPDSARLAVVLWSGIQVFDISTGNVIARLTSLELNDEPNDIYNVIFSGDGRRLAASYQAGAVVWEIESEAVIASIPAHPSRDALALTHDGALLALGCHDGVELWLVTAKGPSRVRRLAGRPRV